MEKITLKKKNPTVIRLVERVQLSERIIVEQFAKCIDIERQLDQAFNLREVSHCR